MDTTEELFRRVCMSCGVDFVTDKESYVLCADCEALRHQDDKREAALRQFPFYSGNY